MPEITRFRNRGVEIYTNGCEETMEATIEFALEWLELGDN